MAPLPADQPISVSVERVRPLISEASSAGVNIASLFQSLNLPMELIDESRTHTVSLADYYRIQNRISILIGDETLHMSSRQLLPGSTDFVLQHVADCKNLYDVMRVVARSYNLLHGGEYNSVEKKSGSIDYIIDDREFPYIGDQSQDYFYFSIECVLIFLHCVLMTFSPDAARAVKGLQLRRPSPGGDCGHLGYWDAPIRFGAPAYRISFQRDISLRQTTPPPPSALTANAVYQKIVETVAGRQAKARMRSAADLVKDALARGVVEQQAVAEQMGVSIATLRRRLTEEGANFRDLRREVLNETAKRLLRSGKPVADVAENLGFSEFRAFNRAFKNWNGVTPKAFIKAAGPDERAVKD